MGSLFSLLITIIIVYGLYKWLTRPRYRIRLTDPITGYIKYLNSVDGINHSFKYTGSDRAALIFTDVTRAERFASIVNDEFRPEIQIKN